MTPKCSCPAFQRISVATYPILLFFGISLCLLSCDKKPKGTVEERLSWAKDLEDQGDREKAYRAYREILSDNPDCAEALFGLGVMDFFKKEYGNAAEGLERYVKLRPAHLHAWRIIGRARMRLGDFRDAYEAFHRANQIEADPTYRELEARALMGCGRDREAKKILEELIEQDPEDHRPVYFLANLSLKQGDIEKARALYRKAIELQPPLVEAYINLASILFKEGEYQEAASLLERTFKEVPLSAPYDPNVRYNLGLCYLGVGDKTKAAENLRKYISLAPEGRYAGEVRELLQGMDKK